MIRTISSNMRRLSTRVLLLITILALAGSVATPALAATGTWIDTKNPANGYGSLPLTRINEYAEESGPQPYGTYGPIPRGQNIGGYLHGMDSSNGYPVSPVDGTPQSPLDCLNDAPLYVINNVAYFLMPADSNVLIGGNYLSPPRQLNPYYEGNASTRCDLLEGYRLGKYVIENQYLQPTQDSYDRVWTLDLVLGSRYGWNINRKKIYDQNDLPTELKNIHINIHIDNNLWPNLGTHLSSAATVLATDPATGHKSFFFFGGSPYHLLNADFLSIYGNERGRHVYVYDIVADRWSVKSSLLPYRIVNASATVLNGKIYLIGGVKSDCIYGDSVSALNEETNKYVTTNLYRYSDSGTKIYCDQFESGFERPVRYWANDTVYVYDLATDTYTKGGTIYDPSPYNDQTYGSRTMARNYRTKHQAIAIGQKIYLFGGTYGHVMAKRSLYDGCNWGYVSPSLDCSQAAVNAIEANRGWAWVYDPAQKAFTSYTAYPGDPGLNNVIWFDAGRSTAALSSDGTRVYSMAVWLGTFVSTQPAFSNGMPLAKDVQSALYTLDLSTGKWEGEPMDSHRIMFHRPWGAATSDGGYVLMGHSICEDDVCQDNIDTKYLGYPLWNRGHFWTLFFKPNLNQPKETLSVQPETLVLSSATTSTSSIGRVLPYIATSTSAIALRARQDVVAKSVAGDTSVTNWAISENTSNAIQARLIGDLDGDGTLTSVDSDLALKYATGIIPKTTFMTAVGDVNLDGAVTSADALLLLKVGTSTPTATLPAYYVVQGLATTTSNPSARVTITYKGTDGIVQTLTVPVVVQETVQLPDLTSSLITPTVASENVPTTFSFTVSNSNVVDTPTGFTSYIQQANSTGSNQSSLGTVKQTTALLKGTSAEVKKSITFSTTGIYYLKGCADQSGPTSNSGGAITELSLIHI